MKAKINLLIIILSSVLLCCSNPDSDFIPEADISEEIVGEWVCDKPEESVWQSMKFVAEGSFFCYSDIKSNWTEKLRNINKGNYGVKGMVVSASNGSTYLDMTVSNINGYQFTGRINETAVDITFSKVVRRIHLYFGESFQPEYDDLVDAKIIGYKSHDEGVAVIDETTGEITAMANNGRTYVDIITESGTAVVKVMVGKINDGDENEISPVGKKNVGTINDPTLNLSKAIVGKWIWDTNYWEEMNFLENGKIYYSNIDEARGIYNENAPGDYTIDTSKRRITLNVFPTGGTQMTITMEIIAINKFSFTAKFFLNSGQTTGTFTYARQIESIELGSGEIRQPEYKTIVGSETIIKSFKTHDSKIVEVNPETGELMAKKGGRTYVDIVTDEGTAVMEIYVAKQIITDYESKNGEYASLLGKEKATIVEKLGNKTFYDTSTDLWYNGKELYANDYKYVTFTLDENTSRACSINLVLNANPDYEEIKAYLTAKYYVFEKGTNATQLAFTDAEELSNSTMGITVGLGNGVITFVDLSYDYGGLGYSKIDFGDYLGKDKAEIKEMMNEYSVISESNTNISFAVGSQYVKMVKFTLDAAAEPAIVKQVDVYLNSDIDQSAVKKAIEKKYKYYGGVEGDYLDYFSDDMKTRVVYNIHFNVIQFIKR